MIEIVKTERVPMEDADGDRSGDFLLHGFFPNTYRPIHLSWEHGGASSVFRLGVQTARDLAAALTACADAVEARNVLVKPEPVAL